MNDATSGTLAVTLVNAAEILLGVACIVIGAALSMLLRPSTDSRLRLSLGLVALVLVLLGVLQLLPHAAELLGPVGIGLGRLLTLLAGVIATLAALAAIAAAIDAVRAELRQRQLLGSAARSLEAGPQPPPSAVTQPARVLIVDDDPELLGLAAGYFERLGIDTITTADPREGIEILRTEGARIEAVVLDFLMPPRIGDALLREIRAFSTVDVYLTGGFDQSGFGDPDLHPDLHPELSGFISKPFRFEDFEARFGAPPARRTETTP